MKKFEELSEEEKTEVQDQVDEVVNKEPEPATTDADNDQDGDD
jgi:RecJ-like exonuclease